MTTHTRSQFILTSALILILLGLGASIRSYRVHAPTTIGGQRDAQGCLTAAGYSWCEAKHTCIRQWEEYCTTTTPKTATFTCANAQRITATFYPGDDKFVDLVLSDGRKLSVPHAISASGARYANADESFVFWNKGDTAFITENGATTYSECSTTA